jgi:hypothetical protein
MTSFGRNSIAHCCIVLVFVQADFLTLVSSDFKILLSVHKPRVGEVFNPQVRSRCVCAHLFICTCGRMIQRMCAFGQDLCTIMHTGAFKVSIQYTRSPRRKCVVNVIAEYREALRYDHTCARWQ